MNKVLDASIDGQLTLETEGKKMAISLEKKEMYTCQTYWENSFLMYIE